MALGRGAAGHGARGRAHARRRTGWRWRGTAPNGQAFLANPLRVLVIDEATATLDGEPLGPPGPLEEQARLGDFLIPQRGLFAVGRAFFDDAPGAR